MGRFLSGEGAAPVTTATRVAPAGYIGEFGNGLWRVFQANGTFVVPKGVSKIRVRVFGAGGAGRGGNQRADAASVSARAHGLPAA